MNGSETNKQQEPARLDCLVGSLHMLLHKEIQSQSQQCVGLIFFFVTGHQQKKYNNKQIRCVQILWQQLLEKCTDPSRLLALRSPAWGQLWRRILTRRQTWRLRWRRTWDHRLRRRTWRWRRRWFRRLLVYSLLLDPIPAKGSVRLGNIAVIHLLPPQKYRSHPRHRRGPHGSLQLADPIAA